MEVIRKDTAYKGNMPKVTNTPIDSGAAAPAQPEAIRISQRTVGTSEEYNELKATVEKSGGKILHAITLRNGTGISVVLQVPTERRSA